MKKPKIEAEEQQPRKVIRADKAPTEGYSLVVFTARIIGRQPLTRT